MVEGHVLSEISAEDFKKDYSPLNLVSIVVCVPFSSAETCKPLVILVIFPAALCSVFQVLGGVLHILHNNSYHLEMCVDSWPTFSTAICYRQKQV